MPVGVSHHLRMNSGGSQANHTGNELVTFIEQGIRREGYERIDGGLLFRNRAQLEKILPPGKYYDREVYVGESIYGGKKRIVDFFLADTDLFPHGLILECKWQDSAGSVEEKYPFLCLCIKKTGIETIVILDGDGSTSGAMAYLRGEVDSHVFRAVWSMKEFQRARNTGFFGSGIMPPRKHQQLAESDSLWKGYPL